MWHPCGNLFDQVVYFEVAKCTDSSKSNFRNKKCHDDTQTKNIVTLGFIKSLEKFKNTSKILRA